MLRRLVRNLFRVIKDSPGASLIELSASLLVFSVASAGFVGTAVVGGAVSSHIEQKDGSMIAARSQAEFIASRPAAPTYPEYPSNPSELDVTTDVVSLKPDLLQKLTISVSGDQEVLNSLEILKAHRFVEVDPLGPTNTADRIIPKSVGLERVKTITVPNIPGQGGFAVTIPQVFSSTRSTDILVQWRLTEPTENRLRTVAIYKGIGDIANTPPASVVLPLVAIGQIRNNPILSVAARAVGTGDFTVQFFNDSQSQDIVTQSARISCVCKIAAP